MIKEQTKEKELNITEIRRNNLIKARKKRAELASKGLLKNKTTLLKENWEAEARDNYLGQIAPFLTKITKAQLDKAIKEGDSRTQQYIINQAIGKPKDRVETDISSETLKRMEERDKVWLKGK